MSRPGVQTLERPHYRYGEEDIEAGLQALAICAGNSHRAEVMLQQLDRPIPHQTLRDWKIRHDERYAEIREQVAPRIRARIAQESEDLAILLGEKEREFIEAINPLELQPRDRPGGLRNISTSKGINVDKDVTLRGLPTAVVEHRKTTDDVLDELKAEGIVVDAEVVSEESEDSEQLPGSSAT